MPEPVFPSTPSHKPRNIIICCDGTGNQFGDSNSNVVKLYTALKVDEDQVAYYHPGVGTMDDPGVRHWIQRKWSIIKGLAFASGFQDNVFDAYQYLMRTYRDGDQVYLFGFSRGSYTARAIAGLLDGYGLLCPGNEGHLPYAWRLYKKQHIDRSKHHLDATKDHADAFKETFSRKDFTHIRFIGVWDTVSSIGWIYTPLRLFYTARNRLVQTGRHAVSIDERRCFYMDNLWGDPYENQDIVQVWFPGVHSDVGGSYPQKESYPANVALEWMIGEARRNGVQLDEERVEIVLGRDPSSNSPIRELYTPPSSPYHQIHPSLKGIWWILELFPHRYFDRGEKDENWRVPFGSRRSLLPGSILHSSVVDRMQNSPTLEDAYDPPNLRNADLVPLDPSTINTNADLSGCYTFQPRPHPRPFLIRTPVRQLVVFLMAVVDILFVLVLVSVVVALLGVVLFIAHKGGHSLWCHLQPSS